MLIPQRKGDPIEFREDEGIRADTTVESLAKLRPAFTKDGTITAGSSSQISDGAAAVVVMSKAKAEELGLSWIAEIGAHGNVAGPDNSLHSQPANAIKDALRKEGLTVADLDLIEINEAFAAVGLQSMTRPRRHRGHRQRQRRRDRARPPDRHVRRAAGADPGLELKRRGGGIGAAALCGGGGQGDALILHVPADLGLQRVTSSRRGVDVARRWSNGARPRRPACGGPADLAGRERLAACCARSPPRWHAHRRHAQVVGLTGSPGVGKSTSTYALVAALRARGKRVGVLAVDPSSPFSGGALLGDRIRMQEHATDDGVFIRSMASRGQLGGLAAAVPQALRVLDAAGCDVVLIETVGVGQAEVEIASLADTTIVLLGARHGRRHPGGQGRHPRDRRHLRREQGRSRRRRPGRPRPAAHAVARRPAPEAGAWRPPIVKTVASRGEGIDDVSRPSPSTAPGCSAAASSTAPATAGPRPEIEAIALGEVRRRFAEVHGSAALERGRARVSSPARPTPTPRPRD